MLNTEKYKKITSLLTLEKTLNTEKYKKNNIRKNVKY
jgi:hypothetical protein